MKKTYLAIILLCTIAMVSCRKSGNDIDIKTYDSNQIRDYIVANGLSAMKRDTIGGDTSNIYYQINRQGRGVALDYDKRIAFSYTIRSLDGKYVAADTIMERSYNFVGLLMPKGLMIAMHNLIKNKGTSARLIIPSRLAYGTSGIGTGSNRLPGNESLDYTINVFDDDNAAAMAAYDDLSIRNYCTANNINISSYTKTASGLYIKVGQVGTGTAAITSTSTITAQYLGLLFNGNTFDKNDTDTGGSFDMQSVVAAWQEGLLGLTSGAKVDLLVPSRLAYGSQVRTAATATGGTTVIIPTYSCLRFGINILGVTN